MIDRDIIQETSSSQSFKRGVQLSHSTKIINLRDDIEADGILHASADVQGSYHATYHVSLTYDMDKKQFLDYECECPAYYQYGGMCKHCVAVALRFAEEEKHFSIEDMGDFVQRGMKSESNLTAKEMKDLIFAYSIGEKAQFFQPGITGTVELEPTLHRDYSKWSVNFRIGCSQKYVVKSIEAFLRALSHSEKVDYGKKLGFIHERGAFTKDAIMWIDFLERQLDFYHHFQRQRMGYSLEGVTRDLPLSEEALGEFLHLNLGRECLLDDYCTADSTVQVLEGTPQLVFHLEKNDQEGFYLVLPKMEAFYGYGHLYVRAEHIFYECPEEYGQNMERICKLGEIGQERRFLINNKDMGGFCGSILTVLNTYAQVEIDGDISEYLPQEGVFKIYLDSYKGYIVGKVEGEYGDHTYNLLENFDITDAFRDAAKESRIVHTMTPYFEGMTTDKSMYIREENEEKVYHLLSVGVDQLEQQGEIYISDAFRRLQITNAPRVSIGVSASGGMLDLKIDAGDLTSEDLRGILSSYRRRKKYFRLKSGAFLNLEDDSLSTLSELAEGLQLKGSQLKAGVLQIPKYRAFYLNQLLKSTSENVESYRDTSFRSIIRNMHAIEDSDYEVPASLREVLRPYQKIGFRWLCTLDDMGFGGILADDMGLGKTLQVLAFLLYKKNSMEKHMTNLIVCPASLVYNWQNEVEHFCPELSTLAVVGTVEERHRLLEEYENYDILITSYDLMKRDVEAYQNVQFYAQIIDEAQNIKNHNTMAAKGVKLVQAVTKFALTGTPIENRLSELWSIFDYLLPGLLGGYQYFKKNFETPIVTNGDAMMTERLQRMIKPFVLRRLKEDVLKELPEKEEHIIYAKMEGEQQRLYAASVQELLDELNHKDKKEFNQSKLQILSHLTRLRQICCDPSLIFENYKGEAAKVDTCMELVHNAIEGGHKVLLFSQFTSLLSILEKRLKQDGIRYYKLTGATSKSDRMEMVDAFNQDDVPLFLISLKAGGTGLNLTGANIVIHFDPWWNVAVQNQATDRAHRIGQKSTVSVFKLIAKNTIEEKIIRLQEQKQGLSDQIISEDGISVSNLTQEDFRGLLEM